MAPRAPIRTPMSQTPTLSPKTPSPPPSIRAAPPRPKLGAITAKSTNMPATDFQSAPGTVVKFPFKGYQQGHRRPGAFHVFRYEESSDPRQVRAQPHRHDF